MVYKIHPKIAPMKNTISFQLTNMQLLTTQVKSGGRKASLGLRHILLPQAPVKRLLNLGPLVEIAFVIQHLKKPHIVCGK